MATQKKNFGKQAASVASVATVPAELEPVDVVVTKRVENESPPEPLSERVNRLVLLLDGDSTEEEFLSASGIIQRLDEFTKFIKQQYKAAIDAWVKQRGPLILGDTKWFIGRQTEKVVLDEEKLFVALFEKCGGDFKTVLAYLCKDPFKLGSISDFFAEDAAKFIRVEEKKVLKDGVATKKEKMLMSTSLSHLEYVKSKKGMIRSQ